MSTRAGATVCTDTVRFVLITSSNAMFRISSHAVSSLLLELACKGERDGKSRVEESLLAASFSTGVSAFLILRENPQMSCSPNVQHSGSVCLSVCSIHIFSTLKYKYNTTKVHSNNRCSVGKLPDLGIPALTNMEMISLERTCGGGDSGAF